MTRALTPAGGSREWRRLVAATLERDGYQCQMIVTVPDAHRRKGEKCAMPATTADHIIPRALGGADTLDNLQAACVPCNLLAGAKLAGRPGADLVRHHNAIIALIAMMDRVGVPHQAGRRMTVAILGRVATHPYRTVDIDAACRFRKHRGPLTRV